MIEGLKVCDFCLRSEIEDLESDDLRHISYMPGDEGLMICDECKRHENYDYT